MLISGCTGGLRWFRRNEPFEEREVSGGAGETLTTKAVGGGVLSATEGASGR